MNTRKLSDNYERLIIKNMKKLERRNIYSYKEVAKNPIHQSTCDTSIMLVC